MTWHRASDSDSGTDSDIGLGLQDSDSDLDRAFCVGCSFFLKPSSARTGTARVRRASPGISV